MCPPVKQNKRRVGVQSSYSRKNKMKIVQRKNSFSRKESAQKVERGGRVDLLGLLGGNRAKSLLL